MLGALFGDPCVMDLTVQGSIFGLLSFSDPHPAQNYTIDTSGVALRGTLQQKIVSFAGLLLPLPPNGYPKG